MRAENLAVQGFIIHFHGFSRFYIKIKLFNRTRTVKNNHATTVKIPRENMKNLEPVVIKSRKSQLLNE